MATTKFELDKFKGDKDSNLWRIKMKALLVHQVLYSTLVKQEGETDKDEKIDNFSAKILSKSHSALILSLGD